MQSSTCSFANSPKETGSLSIIATCLTSMIGSSILIFPLLYKTYGLLTVQGIFTLLALISYKTCTLILLHSSAEEDDFGQVTRRHMSLGWFRLHSLTGALNQVLMSMVYYMLFLNVGYKQLEYICAHNAIPLLSKDECTFSQFSFQYFNCISIFLLALLLLIKDLRLVLRMASLAFLGVGMYILFCLYLAQENLHRMHQEGKDLRSHLTLFSPQVEIVIGSLAQSLLVHNNVAVVFNSAKRPESNLRDIRLVYLLTYLSYTMIGVSGCLGLLDRAPVVKQQNTMLDFLSSESSAVFFINWFLMLKYVL